MCTQFGFKLICLVCSGKKIFFWFGVVDSSHYNPVAFILYINHCCSFWLSVHGYVQVPRVCERKMCVKKLRKLKYLPKIIRLTAPQRMPQKRILPSQTSLHPPLQIPDFWCNSFLVSIPLLFNFILSLSFSCLYVLSSNHLPVRRCFNIWNVCFFISVRGHFLSSSGPEPLTFTPILLLRLSAWICLAWVSIRLMRTAATYTAFTAFEVLTECFVEDSVHPHYDRDRHHPIYR